MKSFVRTFFTASVFSVLLSGCSPGKWLAQLYVVKAENFVDKANSLKAKKIPFEKRVSLYGEACDYFMKAYQQQQDVFTLNRIELASDSCWKGGKMQERDFFTDYEAVYIKTHPQEFEHGDAGVGMVDMGG